MPPRNRRIPGVRNASEGTEQTAAPHEGIETDDLSPDVEKVLAEVGESASAVVVWRMKEAKPGEWEYITRMPAAEYTNEYLKEQFGGGEYKIVIVDNVQGPLNPVFLSIDRRFVGRLFNSAPAAVAHSNGDPFKDRLLEILLTKMLTQPAPQQRSDLDTVLAVAALFKNDGGGNVQEQVSAMLQTAMTLAQAMNPPEGLAGIASQFLPVVDRLVPRAAVTSNLPRRIPAQNPPPPSTPVTHVMTPPTTATPTPTPARVAGTITPPSVPAWLVPFAALAPMLVGLADQGADATVYADVALDRMMNDEATFTAAVESMTAKRLLTDLYAFAPALEETDERKQFAADLVARVEEGITETLSQADEDDAAEANG